VPKIPSGIGHGGGGASPYVATWNGSNYIVDNNVMPFSEGMGGVKSFDYYRIQRPMVQTPGGYKLVLTELGAQHSFFDRVRLFAVDRPADAGLAISLYNQTFTYKRPNPLVSAIDNTGADQTAVLSKPDGLFYTGGNGTYVTLDFGTVNATYGARLLIKADPVLCRICKLSIYIQVRTSAIAWRNVTLVVPRSNWYTEAVDLSSFLPDPLGGFKVRLLFSTNHRVDYVALDTSKQQSISVQEANLIQATHSFYGDVTNALKYSDNVYTDVLFQDTIELLFQAPPTNGGVREFILICDGYVTS
jgi:hypothetical protein